MKNTKGITLIALIITIIVMLILVAVSISVALNTGLFKSAGDATKNWKVAQDVESNAGKSINIDGKEYGSIEDYINGMEIVQPLNPKDWEYRVEDDNTITITGYLNEDETIDTVVVPNYIGELPVKKVVGKAYAEYGHIQPIWNAKICESSIFLPGTSYSVVVNKTIKKIIVSNGIESIENGAFGATVNLREVVLPNTLLNLQDFQYCLALNTITIPDSVINIGASAFCRSALTTITIPSNVKNIGRGAFSYCVGLKEIRIPGDNVTVGEELFYGVSSITIYVPWKEGQKPDEWDDNWNSCNGATVVYAK